MNLNTKLRRQFLIVSAALLIVIQCMAMPSAAGSGPTEYEVTERITIDGAGGWDFITFDQIRHRLFISRGDRVQVWNAQSKQVAGEIAGTAGVHGVALAQDLGRGFTSNGRANTVTVFSLEDLGVLGTINIPGENPDAILYDPKFKRVYAFNGRSGNVSVIDAVNLKVLANIALDGKPEVGVSDGAGHVFVNIEDTAEIVVINQAENKVQTLWSLAPCTEPTGLAIDAAHQRLFSVCSNRRMMIVDALSGRQVAIMPIGNKPDGAEFDPDRSMVFSANGDGTLTLVHENDPENFTVVANVPTQAKARTLALDPESHRVYLVSALFGPSPAPTVEQPKPRPAVLPDSFTIIVAAPNENASAQLDVSRTLNGLYQQVVANPIRTDGDRHADASRKPLEFMQFADVRPGMSVLDVAAGGGYTTQLLALAVGSNGTVWAQADKPQPALIKRLADHPQPNIVPVVRPFDDPVPNDAPNLDLITIIMNYHDIAYMPVDRAKMNRRLFSALKPGGHLVVIDHSAKKGAGISAAKTLHRIDEAVVLDEFQQAGFQLEQEGDFLYNPSDPRDQAFFNMNMPTDSFALRFVKP